jgi:hypothetical protein
VKSWILASKLPVFLCPNKGPICPRYKDVFPTCQPSRREGPGSALWQCTWDLLLTTLHFGLPCITSIALSSSLKYVLRLCERSDQVARCIVLIVLYLTTFLSNSDFNERMISERWIGKDMKERSWRNLRKYPGICSMDWRKPGKTSVRIAGLRAESWIRDLPNTKDCWPSTTTFGQQVVITSLFSTDFLHI